MRKQSQTRSAGPDRVKPVGDALLQGSGKFAGSQKGGTERKGTQTYDRQGISFRKINNADPGPKN